MEYTSHYGTNDRTDVARRSHERKPDKSAGEAVMQGETDETANDVAQAEDGAAAEIAPVTDGAEAPSQALEASRSASPATPTQEAPAPSAAPATSGNSRALMENRLWIILGILALVSLLFALVAAAANANGAPSGSLASAQQETVALVQNVDPSVVQIQARSVLRSEEHTSELQSLRHL